MSTKKAFAKPTSTGAIRLCDTHGCGTYGAKRGNRIHQGEDYKVAPGENVYSPITGKITRIAYPYASDMSYKGVEIKSEDYTVKIFYMQLTVAVGTVVAAGSKIGVAQNIAAKYSPGMQNHIHVEVRDRSGQLKQFSKLL